MIKAILIILSVMLLCTNYFAQQKTFGYRFSSNGDIVSDVFLIKKGFVLDSVVAKLGDVYESFQFEYDGAGKLRRDYNFITFKIIVDQYNTKYVQGCRNYFYSDSGNVDSILFSQWNDTLQVYDYNGNWIKYSYNNDGKVLLKNQYNNGLLTSSEENSYDQHGNLRSSKIARENNLTTYITKEYDIQNRVIKSTDSTQYYSQRTYEYNSLGDISCTQTGSHISPSNFLFKFDESGKVVTEIQREFNSADSTWKNKLEIVFNYDNNNKISTIGSNYWFYYNSDGNLDTLINPSLPFNRSYLMNKARLVDSYGNEIIFPDYNNEYYFYYSRLVTDVKKGESSIKNFALSQNYPNPFNPSTKIKYSIPQNSFVSLKVYDLLGKEVAVLVNEEKSIGDYEIDFDGSSLSSGVYFYKIQAGNFSDTKKFILLR